jgi:hypothetical protein
MKGSSTMIRKKEMDMRFTQIIHDIKGSSRRAKRMGKAASNGIMVRYMMDNGKTI